MSNLDELRPYFWPRVDDIEAAKKVARLGIWACIADAGLAPLLAFKLIRVADIDRLMVAAFIDAAISSLLALLIYRRSRPASLFALLLFAFKAVRMISIHPEDILMVMTFGWLYFQGLRGTFALHRLQGGSPAN